MTKPAARAGDTGLILQLRAACWAALLIMAAMALASYVYLHQLMGMHLDNHALAALVGAQNTLSQRIAYLAEAAAGTQGSDRPQLLQELAATTADFQRNQELLLSQTGVNSGSAAAPNGNRIDDVLFSAPYRLDRHAKALIANTGRLVAALGAPAEAAAALESVPATHERLTPVREVADGAMSGFNALQRQIAGQDEERLDGMLTTHAALFVAKLVALLVVGTFIFRPITKVARRRTQELIDARDSMALVAVRDGLTGLHNRSFLIDHFDAILAGAKRRRERFAVLQIDLDRFKQINDSLGHEAGDFVLVKTAERMRDSCRASDICARLGGDEFVMVLGAVGTSQDTANVVRRILSRINEPLDFEGVTIQLGASAGVAVYPLDAETANDLLVGADLALYAAKRLGGGHFSFFSAELRQELEHRKQLEGDLKAAIAERAFIVHFQPQISLRDGRIAGVEALIRWEHPERGMISPGEFLPVAEKVGLMADIGRIAIAKAIGQAAEWHRSGITFGRLAVNVSGAELREAGFVGFLFDTLEKAGLPPQKLAVEIVESVILDDDSTGIAATLRQIRAAGVHLELDDFGTGYASLAHVNPNEIDRLKIDRRFVQNIHANSDNTKIVRAITELARGLGISIIAEGAETEDELESLLSVGCDQVQGYSVAFPMPEAQARDWLAAHSPNRPALRACEGMQA
jgi:diguanylate cyclase (GGDEF)-like protein